MNEPLSLRGIARLSDRGAIRARGADAGKFLQGQLTNDVLSLGVAHARLAGFCSAKGRLQASFIVWRAGDDEFVLVCALDLLAATLKRLSMFVLRAKCTLSDATGELALWGAAGDAAATFAAGLGVWGKREADGRVAVRLPDAEGVARTLVAAPASLALVDLGALATVELPLEAWQRLDVRSGVVSIEAATVDRFVPQMVNFELVGGVDFKKGCYPGQEVVARSQYRGTTKRRAFLFECDAPVVAGQDVFAGNEAAASGEPAGTVAFAAAAPGGSSALIEVRLATLGQGELHLGSPGGAALRRLPMPYDVPLDSDAAA